MEGGKIKKTRKLRHKFKKGQFRSGPETIIYKDYRMLNRTYNFKVGKEKIDIIKRMIFFFKFIVNEDYIPKKIKSKYFPNLSSDNVTYFEHHTLSLIRDSKKTAKRTLLFIPWNIHFSCLREFNYNPDYGHVTIEPDLRNRSNSSPKKEKSIFSRPIHYGYNKLTGKVEFWGNHKRNVLRDWEARNLIRAVIYFYSELVTYGDTNEFQNISTMSESKIDNDLSYYENLFSAKTHLSTPTK